MCQGEFTLLDINTPVDTTLTSRTQAWVDMGASEWALTVLRTGYSLVWDSERAPLTDKPIRFPLPVLQAAQEVLDIEVKTLLDKRAIAVVKDPSTKGFYCRLFTVPKATGGFRPVLDLSPLNKFLRHIHFKMDTPTLVRHAIRPNDWSVSVDLRDAFFHVPINQRDRKWLRFQWRTVTYQFQVLPFGLNQSPWAFTRMVREVVRWARLQGIRMTSYMDDWLVLAQTPTECSLHLGVLVEQSTRLGFRVHPDKSDFTPSQRFQYLGILFDTVSWTVQPAQKRRDSFQRLLDTLSRKRYATARQLASLLGMMESMADLLPLGRVYKRPLQRQLAANFKQSQEPWSKNILLVPWFQEVVAQWRIPMWLNSSVPLTMPPHVHEVYVDASQQGWGAHTLFLSASGRWSEQEVGRHINFLELRAVTRALEAFQKELTPGHILVRSDSSTVVAQISHQGGTHSAVLSMETERLMIWAEKHGWALSAKHLKGSLNVMADLLSRPDSILPTEWTLDHSVLNFLWEKWDKPMVDLFATRCNHRLPVYVSPVPDEEAWEVDALSLSWTGLDAYAFPPFSLIPRVLQKARVEGPRLVLIAPMWPWMLWFTTAMELAHAPPLPLPVHKNSLFQPRSKVPHGNPEALNLHAWLLCGAHCAGRACQKMP